jgi:hypothetical protein
MNRFLQRFLLVAQLTVVVLVLFLSGCGRSDTRVNSDPGPGRPSRADGDDKAVRPDPNNATPSTRSSDPTTGTDSTGRPSSASGGATAAGAGSGTSGTAIPADRKAK